MLMIEKIRYLESNHFSDWLDTRRKVDDELSSKQTMMCVCGRLATGMHERSCSRYNAKVNSQTVKRLKHLLPEKVKA